MSASLFSQSNLGGRLTDQATETPMVGAHILLMDVDSNVVQTVLSNERGGFRLQNVAPGQYIVQISYTGYEEVWVNTEVTDEPFKRLGMFRMKAGVNLEAIEVTESVVPVQQDGDTTTFNAEAFKTLPDASAEELIEKMPTVVVENGKVQAQGEDVQQVLVDGKQFFGNDPTAALRNLPAEVIDKIQVFDQQSDQSRFTGFDDGETTKTINIVTKKDMRNGQFGKIYAGYGTFDFYEAGGNINVFNGDQRISLIGMSNNINQQNFSTEDLLGVVGSNNNSGRRGRGGGRGRGRNQNAGASASDFLVGQQLGVATTHAAGVNLIDKWGEKVEVSASYFFNLSNNALDQITQQQFFSDEGINESYDEFYEVESTNLNHRFNGFLKASLNEKNTLIWRPSLSFQDNVGMDFLSGQTMLGPDTTNLTQNLLAADLSTYNLNNNLIWQHKFDKQRRTFSARLSGGLAPKNGNRILDSENIFLLDNTMNTILDQSSMLDINSWNGAANLQYTEPVGQKGMLMINYRSSYQQEESDRETFDFNSLNEQYDLLNQDLSNVFSNDYITQQLGGGYNMRIGKTMIVARANMQWANLANEQLLPTENTYNNTFWNVLPMAFLRYKPSKNENLRIGYRSSTDLPNIEQLQNVVDNTNPVQLSVGNPDLEQSFTNRIFGRYTKTNTEKSTVFFAMVNGTYTNNYIANSTYLSSSRSPVLADYNLEEGVQLTLPVNLNGQWNARTFITYGIPLKFIKSNINLDLTGSMSRTPGLVNDELNYANNRTAGLGLTLSSNFSDRVDFTLSSRSNYNVVNNSLQADDNTISFIQNSRLKFNWIIFKGLTFRTDVSYQTFSGFDDEFLDDILLISLSIGKKLFKDDRGEVSVMAFDLLGQNNNLARTVTETYIEDVQSNALTQYIMLKFKYDIRHFKVGSK